MSFTITTRDIAHALGVNVSRVYALLTELDTVYGIQIPKNRRRIIWTDDLIAALEDLAMMKGWINDRILSKRTLEEITK